MKVELSQEKIEHAVLWSIVRHGYSDGFIDADHVAAKLNGYFAPSQIDAAIRHLVACDMLEPRHAPMQEHYIPNRRAFKKIDTLSANVATFVGRLNKHGVTFLPSKAAKEARLESQISPQSNASTSQSSASQPAISVNVLPQISPTFNNQQSAETQPITSAAGRSNTVAAWLGVIAAIVIGAITISIMKGWL